MFNVVLSTTLGKGCCAFKWRYTNYTDPGALCASAPIQDQAFMSSRNTFVISDRTGLTAEALSHSLLSQFPKVQFDVENLPFIDSVEKARQTVQTINANAQRNGVKPLVFATLVNDEIRAIIADANAVFFDLFDTFIEPLEKELSVESSHSVGKSHGVLDFAQYSARMSAVNFAMTTDDGMETDHYARADVVVIGPSRTGKTPTCLYLSLQFGVFAANYPLTDSDLESIDLPPALAKYRQKLFGLSIDPFRLQQIRQERFAGDIYASPKTCQFEVAQAEAMYRSSGVSYVNTTKKSVEEIGAYILHKASLRRKL